MLVRSCDQWKKAKKLLEIHKDQWNQAQQGFCAQVQWAAQCLVYQQDLVVAYVLAQDSVSDCILYKTVWLVLELFGVYDEAHMYRAMLM
jgi:hypothetical protein